MRRLLILLVLASQALAADYLVPKDTHSPDGRFAVSVVKGGWDGQTGGPRNQLLRRSDGHVVAALPGIAAWEHQNHGGHTAKWSPDSSLLLWTVDGKWFPRSLVLLRLEGEKVLWQHELMTLLQKEILRRTREAQPKRYAAWKKKNPEYGSAYPEGFSVDVLLPEGELRLPLTFKVILTSNPKDREEEGGLNSWLTGEVRADGSLGWHQFQLGIETGPRF